MSSSSSSSYGRRSDQRSYLSSNPTAVHSYATHPGMISAMNNSGQTYLAYFPANPVNFLISSIEDSQ